MQLSNWQIAVLAPVMLVAVARWQATALGLPLTFIEAVWVVALGLAFSLPLVGLAHWLGGSGQ